MASTTKENVLTIAPELQDCFTNESLDMIIADVNEQVGSEFSKKQEMAQRYLAAHILTQLLPTTSKESLGGIQSEKLAERTVNYGELANIKGASRYDSTVYGKMFEQIKKQSILGFSVVQP